MKIMHKRKIIKKNIKKKQTNKQKTNTITTNKTLITNNTHSGREKKNTYLLHPNYEKTTLQRKHHVH